MAVIDLSPFNTILQRLEGVADRLERGAPAGGAAAAAPAAASPAAGGGGEAPAIAKSFDAFMFAKVGPLDAAAKDTGSAEIGTATEGIVAALRMLRSIVAGTGAAKKPKDQDWKNIFGPLAELSQKAGRACDNRNDFFQAQKVGAEALGLVQLVMGTAPASHVKAVLETCDFHLVKVMQKKVPAETAWGKLVKELLKGLEEWCIENCKMGLTWKFDGQDAGDYFTSNPIGSPAAGAAAPAKAAAPEKKAGGMGAIFGSILGKDATGLKKVTDDQKVKNRSAEDSAAASAAASAAKPKAFVPKPRANEGRKKGPKGAPIKELQRDTNWVIENQEGVSNLTLDEADMKQTVLVINCREITLQVTTKVKSITIDGCEKVNLICGDVLSTVELVNSDKCKVQTIGTLNAIAIDKCDGVAIFLSKQSVGASIVTSKSSEMNVTIPEGDEGDIIEMPIPEQFMTRLAPSGKKLITEVSDLYH